MRKYTYIDQSSWIAKYYNLLQFDKKQGFLVELGVGNIISYPGRDTPNSVIPDNYIRGGSNTSELLDIGWSGVYVDPVVEFLDQCRVAYKDNLSRLTLLNCGVSDKEEILVVGDGESLVSNRYNEQLTYIGRKIQCVNINTILEKYCPNKIDLLSIDIEGMEGIVLNAINYNRFKFNMIIVEINKVSNAVISSILPSEYICVQLDDLNAVYINTKYELYT